MYIIINLAIKSNVNTIMLKFEDVKDEHFENKILFYHVLFFLFYFGDIVNQRTRTEYFTCL